MGDDQKKGEASKPQLREVPISTTGTIGIQENGTPVEYDPANLNDIPIANDAYFPTTIQSGTVALDIPQGEVKAIRPASAGPTVVHTTKVVVTFNPYDFSYTTRTTTSGPIEFNGRGDATPRGTVRRFNPDGTLS